MLLVKESLDYCLLKPVPSAQPSVLRLNLNMGSLPSPAVLSTIDDLVRTRGDTCTGIPILAYPRAGGSLTSFEYFTAHDLDRFVEWTAQKLLTLGLRPMASSVLVATGQHRRSEY